jgi:cytidylate kinase
MALSKARIVPFFRSSFRRNIPLTVSLKLRLPPSRPPTTLSCTKLFLPTTSIKFIMAISRETLVKQNAETSNAIIAHWKDSDAFLALAKAEGDLTMQRDEEDAINLQKGIDFAKSKGVIDPNYVSQPYVSLDVLGKTPATVAEEILTAIKGDSNSNNSETNNDGSVIVLCGLSGTGKGTTVSILSHKLEADEGKKVVTWSNGNIFRSVTLLAVTWCEQQSDIDGFDKDKALTKENLQSFMRMLSFGKFNGKYDTHINGLGLDMLVSEVQNTELKSPKVSKNISTVAEVTQGEVILFAADAVDTMGKDGLFVLLEGREQTVNYVRTPFRFTLVLSDESLIGKRRAAQRVMAAALSKLSETATDEEVGKALDESLEEMTSETR